MAGRVLLATTLAAILVDQGSKWGVIHLLDLRSRLALDVWPPFLRFRMGWNEGINFGLLDGMPGIMRWLLIALAVGVSLWVARLALRDGRGRVAVAAGLLAGGALSNALDRLIHGAVADFLNMSCCGIANPFVFNLADVAVFAGALGLVLWASPQKTP
ncbi:MAG: signal peptidase II [Qingshengfaniella sp.]